MRVKKLISIALFTAIGTTSQAQIVSSQSNQVIVTEQVKPKKPKKPRNFQWYLKAGVSIDDLAGAKGVGGSSVGYDASFGFIKPTTTEKLFWGSELGIMSIGCESAYLDVTKQHAISVTPFIGYDIANYGNFKISPYIGPYLSYTLNTFEDYYDGNGWIGKDSKLSGGINVGVGFWIGKNFSFDIHFRRALLKNMKGNYHNEDYSAFSQKIVLGVGFAF